MSIAESELKSRILELLRKDVEFRYAVAGLIGLEEILRRLDRHEEELKKLREDFNKLSEAFNKLYEKFLEHGKRLSRIELELGALSESFYCKALWDDLREEIQRAGEKVVLKKRNALVGEEEVDMLVVTDKKVYVVEVKVKPKHEDVGRLVAKADVARKHYPDREVVAILAGAMISREIEEYAREKNILVYQY